jgi:hypothetical protein
MPDHTYLGDVDDDRWDDELEVLVYLEYQFEGAASLTDPSAALRSFADDLDVRQAAGWRLATPVDRVPVDLERQTATMFTRHNELSAAKRRVANREMRTSRRPVAVGDVRACEPVRSAAELA